MMNVTLFLMTKKGHDVLCTLINSEFSSHVNSVIIGRDDNVDNDYVEDMIKICRDNKIIYFEKKDDYEITADYTIAISWRWLIPINRSTLIVLHDSILPKYRGFAPLVNMLINKEPSIGVTAFLANKEFDKGDILFQTSTEIKYPIKIQEAIDKIAPLYVNIVLNIFGDLKSEKLLTATKQNEEDASYCLWLNEDDYLVNWNSTSNDILTFINSVSSPYKGAATFMDGKNKIRIIDAEVIDDLIIENRHVGKIIFFIDTFPVIVCGTGLLKIKHAVNENNGQSALPFKTFRIKLSDQY